MLKNTIILDTKLRINELQEKIINTLKIEKENVRFEFHQMPDYVDLDLITINPNHQQSFLFHSTEGRDKIEALEQMLNYINIQLSIENSYTVQWKLTGSIKIHTSYFRAKNILDAIDKLYFGRSIGSVIIYSINLNPMS